MMENLKKTSSHCVASEKSFSVIPPSSCVVSVNVTWSKRISISGWWFIFLAFMAIRLTKVMLFRNPANLKVRQMVCAHCDQFETAFKLALICLGVKAGIAINHSWFLLEPLFLPPLVSLFTVAQARASAVFMPTLFFS